MKRLLSLVGCALLALTFLAPSVANAVPITLSLDNPNQSVPAPSSGFVTIDFTGTVTVDPNYHLTFGSLDSPHNSSQSNFLPGVFNEAFLDFFMDAGTGTYTGSLFELIVPAGTPADFYGFAMGSSNPSMFTLIAQFTGGKTAEGVNQFTASQAFSVLLTGGTTPVPEGGSSIFFLGLSLSTLCVAQRVFALREKRLAA